jgi:hypothetical protein
VVVVSDEACEQPVNQPRQPVATALVPGIGDPTGCEGGPRRGANVTTGATGGAAGPSPRDGTGAAGGGGGSGYAGSGGDATGTTAVRTINRELRGGLLSPADLEARVWQLICELQQDFDDVACLNDLDGFD